MRLVACQNCHTQYDVSDVSAETVRCRCGEEVANEVLKPVDVQIHRCGSCGAQLDGDANDCTYCGSDVVRDPRNLSLICPECHGRNADDSRFCTACGVAFSPEKVNVDGHELPCPVCACLMPSRAIGGIGVNECPKCNGLWAPEKRLDALITRAIEARQSDDPVLKAHFEPRVTGSNPAGQQVTYRKCPECEAFMQRRNFRRSSGVIIDRCHNHGTWLDADELEQITGFVMSGGNPAGAAILGEAKLAAAKVRSGEEFARIANTTEWTSKTRSMGTGDGLVATLVSVFEKILD